MERTGRRAEPANGIHALTNPGHGGTGLSGNPTQITFANVKQMQTDQVIAERVDILTGTELEVKTFLNRTCTDSGRLQGLYGFQCALCQFRCDPVFVRKGIQIFGEVATGCQKMQNTAGKLDGTVVKPAEAKLLFEILYVRIGSGHLFQVCLGPGTLTAAVSCSNLHDIVLRRLSGRYVFKRGIFLNGFEHVRAESLKIK
jgi:hypothetical protein